MSDLEVINDSTYAVVDEVNSVRTVIGDETSVDFVPMLVVERQDVDATISLALDFDSAGSHLVYEEEAIVVWEEPDLSAKFYPIIDTSVISNAIRFIDQGEVDIYILAAQYELDRHIPQDKLLINKHAPNVECIMHYGDESADTYLDASLVDLPELRLSVLGPISDPMFLDQGLVLVDIHYKSSDDLAFMSECWHQAIHNIFSNYATISNDGAEKQYFQDGIKTVKFVSSGFVNGHYVTYINIDSDYNRIQDYWKQDFPISEPNAYGIRAIDNTITTSHVNDVIVEFASLYGLPIENSAWTPDEIAVINSLIGIHTDNEWIQSAERSDVHYDNAFIQSGYELEITLESMPASNVIPLTVALSGVEVFYQDHEDFLSNGGVRPHHVRGSFAIYTESDHENKRDSTKVLHIYRPWAEDAMGIKVWCDFDPTWDGVDDLNIIIPQSFLDVAVFPIVIDPTLGYAGSGASTSTDAGVLHGVPVTGVLGTVVQGFFYGQSLQSTNTMYLYRVDDSRKVLAGNMTGLDDVNAWYGSEEMSTRVLATDYYVCYAGTGGGYVSFGLRYDAVSGAGVDGAGDGADEENFTVVDKKYSVYVAYKAPPITARTSNYTPLASNTSASLNFVYPAAPYYKSILVAATYSNVAAAQSISGSGWTQVASRLFGAGSIHQISLWAKIVEVGTKTYTLTTTGSTVSRAMGLEYDGVIYTSIAAATDQTNSNIDAGANVTTLTSGSITTTSANDVLIAAWGLDSTSSAWSVGSSFTIRGSNTRMVVADRIVTGTGTYNPSLTWTTSRRVGAVIISLKETAALLLGKSIGTTGVG